MKKLATPFVSGVTAIKGKTKPRITPNTSKALTLSNSPKLSAAKQAFDSIAATLSTSDIRLHNSLLHSYASVSASLSDSTALLRHMVKACPSFSPDRSTYHVLLSQSCSAPDPSLSAVHDAFNLMSAAGFPPDQASADIALRTLLSDGRIDSALQLFDEMVAKNATPDSNTYNFLVKCLCKRRSLSVIYSFIEKARDSFGIKPDLVTYSILIDNVCNSKDLREMTRLVCVLLDEGFTPDRLLYNTIIKGYCLLSRTGEAVEVFNKMKKSGVSPNIVTYNTLIFGLARAGRVKDAQEYLSAMEADGHLPDVVTYTALMNGLFREKNPERAYRLLEVMRSRGCKPNSCTYNTLLHGFFKERSMERAMGLFQDMKEAGIKLESVSYNVAVRILCRSKRVVEAYEVFDYAVHSKSLTDLVAYAMLERSLAMANKAREFGRDHRLSRE